MMLEKSTAISMNVSIKSVNWLLRRRKRKCSSLLTHFSQERAMELSKRPFKNVREMDWTMIERWNSVVGPNDTVYHLGDFGESWPIEYLNGNIVFVKGNYERDGKSPVPPNVTIYGDGESLTLKDNGRPWLIMAHEGRLVRLLFKRRNRAMKLIPCSIRSYSRKTESERVGRNTTSEVDANNFTPVSRDDLFFYFNAIERILRPRRLVLNSVEEYEK